MSRIPIRLRLAIISAVATTAVLAGASVFVYERLDSDLTETLDEALESSAVVITTAPGERAVTAAAPADGDDGFAQIYDVDGRVAQSRGANLAAILSAAELRRAEQETFTVEREIDGVDGVTRVLAGPIDGAAPSNAVAFAVGRSAEDRDETLADLVAAFAVGGPVAVLIASLIGVALARSALGPIESMRARAEEISLEPGEPLLPLPRAEDEVRRLGETLNEMLERLRASFERERRFVADAAHELRTPIAVIHAELDAAGRAPDLGPLARESMTQALAECDRLAALAEDLLVLARAADGALAVRIARLDAAVELDSARVRFAERAAAAGRAIRVDVRPGLTVDADPLRLRQTLGNLVDNALRHGQGTIVLSGRPVGDATEIEVSDEGPGFAEDMADSAFERFTRGDEARSGGGAGLGLAIVRTIAEAHAGTAEIGERGHGSVRIRFPARSQGDLSNRF